MEVQAGPSKGKTKICTESLKVRYKKEFMSQLRQMVYMQIEVLP
jgi:hypothetical protein